MKKDNFKKILCILFFNLLIFGILLTGVSYFIDKKIEDNTIDVFLPKYEIDESGIDISKYETEPGVVKLLEWNDVSYNKFCGENREKFGERFTKNSIIVLGCSYAYGHGLKKEESFSYLLSNLTKRPVFNFAGCADNIFFSIERLTSFKNKDINNQDKINNADYVIYIYMHDHINRYLQVSNIYRSTFSDRAVNNKFISGIIKIPLIKFLCSLYKLKQIIKGMPYNDSSDEYLKSLMIMAQDKLKELVPNAKFIIILYNEKISDEETALKIKFDSDRINSKIWEELQNENSIIIVRTKDVTGFSFDKNYKLEEDIRGWHPNAKAWEVFTPLFVQRYIR